MYEEADAVQEAAGVSGGVLAQANAESQVFRAYAAGCEGAALLLPRGVLAVQVRGRVTLPAIRALRREIGEMFGRKTRAYVVDYRLARIDMEPRDFDDSVLDAFQHVPGAVVVAPGQQPGFCASAVRTARVAVIRRVFLAPEEAVRWAVRLVSLEA